MPLLIGERRWIPELETETLLLHRIFLAEKWLVARLHYGHVDPREAGVGNIVNCGAAMYMTPVGVVNAADPAAAYAEAIDVAGAHQSSYGREAAGVFAAAVAAATSTGGVDRVGRRGRRRAGPRRHPARLSTPSSRWRPSSPTGVPLWDHCATPSHPSTPSAREYREPAMDARRPSRTKSIEELPIALGLALVADGEYREAVLGGGQLRTRLRLDRHDGGGDRRRPRRCRRRAAGLVGAGRHGEQGGSDDSGGDACRRDATDLAARCRTGRSRSCPCNVDDVGASDEAPARSGHAASDCGVAGRMIRLTWAQPEDLVAHALAAKRLDGCDVARSPNAGLQRGATSTHRTAGRPPSRQRPPSEPSPAGSSPSSTRWPLPAALLDDEPDDVEAIAALAPGSFSVAAGADVADRVHGGWLGRAAGCLLGKPVEKIPREGIRAIAESTGNWPLRTYFTAAGLDPGVAAAYPWNRASRTTSLVENIAGMPEDDDLNYALLALTLAERHGDALTTDDVALAWLELLPAKRVFTAERIAYRNLLDGYEPDEAGAVGNPFQDWIGAQIRTDVYGWICPGDPARAARPGMAGRSPQSPPQRPVRGDVRRRGIVGGGHCGDGRRVRRRRAVGGPRREPLRHGDPARRRAGTQQPRHRGRDRCLVRRLRPPPLGARAQQRRPPGVRPDPQPRRLRHGDHDRRVGGLGHRLDGGHRRLDLRCAHRRGEAAIGVDRSARQPSVDEHAGLRRHRLRRARRGERWQRD